MGCCAAKQADQADVHLPPKAAEEARSLLGGEADLQAIVVKEAPTGDSSIFDQRFPNEPATPRKMSLHIGQAVSVPASSAQEQEQSPAGGVGQPPAASSPAVPAEPPAAAPAVKDADADADADAAMLAVWLRHVLVQARPQGGDDAEQLFKVPKPLRPLVSGRLARSASDSFEFRLTWDEEGCREWQSYYRAVGAVDKARQVGWHGG